MNTVIDMAERQGFEPWVPCGTHALQARAFDHSATSPLCSIFSQQIGSRVPLLRDERS